MFPEATKIGVGALDEADEVRTSIFKKSILKLFFLMKLQITKSIRKFFI
jgi:hypothetical protein